MSETPPPKPLPYLVNKRIARVLAVGEARGGEFRPISPLSSSTSRSRPSSLGSRFSGSPSGSASPASPAVMGGAGTESPAAVIPSPASAIDTNTAGWRIKYNQKPDECRWPLPAPSKDVLDCNFPFRDPRFIRDNIAIATLPAGTRLYHATTIFPTQSPWFRTMTSFRTLPKTVMWFASTPEHAKHMTLTHVLEFVTKKDIKLLFIRNLFAQFGTPTGNDIIHHPEFKHLINSEEGIVGYAGCNECEIGIFKQFLDEYVDVPPKIIEERSFVYLNGGSRRLKKSYRKHRSNKTKTRIHKPRHRKSRLTKRMN